MTSSGIYFAPVTKKWYFEGVHGAPATLETIGDPKQITPPMDQLVEVSDEDYVAFANAQARLEPVEIGEDGVPRVVEQ